MASTSDYQSALDATLSQGAALTEVVNNKKNYNNKADQVISTTETTSNFSEIPTSYDTSYPYNDAKLTESGHLMEFDDTPGGERVSIAHRTGTFYEIHPDGSQMEKIVNDNVQVVMKDGYIYIMGNSQQSVQGHLKVYIKGNAKVQVDGDVEFEVGGNMFMKVDGKFTAQAEEFNFIGPINQIGDFATTGNISVQQNVVVEKEIHSKLNITTDSDVIAGDTKEKISLLNHVHGGISIGGSVTDVPE